MEVGAGAVEWSNGSDSEARAWRRAGSLPVLGREMGAPGQACDLWSSGRELLAMSTDTMTLSFQENNTNPMAFVWISHIIDIDLVRLYLEVFDT